MISKLVYLMLIVGSGIVTIECKSTSYKELKPVLIKSVITHPKGLLPSHDDLTSRKIYQIGLRPNYGESYQSQQESPERGQILHRPKSTNSDRNGNGYGSQSYGSQSHSPHMEMEMANDAPMIINGRGKKVKYVPTNNGYSSPETDTEHNNHNNINQHGHVPQRPPQVYVISGGEEEEEENPGMMGSMQNYFKSIPGRIKAAMQGLIGGVTD